MIRIKDKKGNYKQVVPHRDEVEEKEVDDILEAEYGEIIENNDKTHIFIIDPVTITGGTEHNSNREVKPLVTGSNKNKDHDEEEFYGGDDMEDIHVDLEALEEKKKKKKKLQSCTRRTSKKKDNNYIGRIKMLGLFCFILVTITTCILLLATPEHYNFLFFLQQEENSTSTTSSAINDDGCKNGTIAAKSTFSHGIGVDVVDNTKNTIINNSNDIDDKKKSKTFHPTPVPKGIWFENENFNKNDNGNKDEDVVEKEKEKKSDSNTQFENKSKNQNNQNKINEEIEEEEQNEKDTNVIVSATSTITSLSSNKKQPETAKGIWLEDEKSTKSKKSKSTSAPSVENHTENDNENKKKKHKKHKHKNKNKADGSDMTASTNGSSGKDKEEHKNKDDGDGDDDDNNDKSKPNEFEPNGFDAISMTIPTNGLVNHKDGPSNTQITSGSSTIITKEESSIRPTIATNKKKTFPVDASLIPQSNRMDAIKYIIEKLGISKAKNIENSNSAAYHALWWLSQGDEAQLIIPGFDTALDNDNDWFLQLEQLLQRYALVVFYYEMKTISTTKKNKHLFHKASQQETINRMTFDTNWKHNGHVCTWFGVICEEERNVVIGLNVSQSVLYGTLPRELFSPAALPQLSTLDLSHNQLHGLLPKMGAVKSESVFWDDNEADGLLPLKLLDLSHNQLSNKLYPLRHFEQLTLLDVSSNQFTGKLPVNFNNLVDLEILRLNNNKLNEQVPPLGKLKHLKSLSIEGNSLTGWMPSNICHLRQNANLQFLTADCTDGHIKCPGTCCTSCF